jgi:hypothetical protein
MPCSDTEDNAGTHARFIVELEFVQMLSNVEYLEFLSSHHFLDQPAFISYLHHLSYWDTPRYSTHLRYPQCLYFLHQLRDPRFRAQLAKHEFISWLRGQQMRQWKGLGEQVRLFLAQADAAAHIAPLTILHRARQHGHQTSCICSRRSC